MLLQLPTDAQNRAPCKQTRFLLTTFWRVGARDAQSIARAGACGQEGRIGEMGTTYSAELESVELKSFCRFVNRHWTRTTPRLTAEQAAGGDDYGAGWILSSYGKAAGWLDARQLKKDRLSVRLHLNEDIDDTIPPGEPDAPEPWQERRLIDWILGFAVGWLKYHYGADLIQEGGKTPDPTPAPASSAAGSDDKDIRDGVCERVIEMHRLLKINDGEMSHRQAARIAGTDTRTYKEYCLRCTGEGPIKPYR